MRTELKDMGTVFRGELHEKLFVWPSKLIARYSLDLPCREAETSTHAGKKNLVNSI